MSEICGCPKHRTFDRKYLNVEPGEGTQRNNQKKSKMMENGIGKVPTCLSQIAAGNRRANMILLLVSTQAHVDILRTNIRPLPT